MKLADYLTTNRETFAAFARRIGVANAKVVQRYANGERVPQPDIMRRIVEATGGLVRPDDFYPPDPSPPTGGGPSGGAETSNPPPLSHACPTKDFS